MTKFSNVIVRRPAKSMVEGITSAPELGKPDYEKALKQHDDYIAALKECGVEVTVLPALEQFPDSCSSRIPRSSRAAAPSSRTRAPTAATARRTRSSRPCASSSTTSM